MSGTSLANSLRKLIGANPKPTGYRLFDARLKQRIPLSPSLSRLVFEGPDIRHMRTLAADQRIKLLFPAPDGSAPSLPHDDNWQAARRALPAPQQPPMRTYTIRALRPMEQELDVDFVLHGETGPASTWATRARPGDPVQIVAPNADFSGDPGGYEWQPPCGARQILLIGDETALPALAGILETLYRHADRPQVQAFIEVPHEADCLPLPCHQQTQLHWLPRDRLGVSHGAAMLQAARELAQLPAALNTPQKVQALKEIDLEQQRLWEQAQPVNNDFYAWVAGESAAVMAIRRHLVNERGLDRRALTLMGYWRLGRSID